MGLLAAPNLWVLGLTLAGVVSVAVAQPAVPQARLDAAATSAVQFFRQVPNPTQVDAHLVQAYLNAQYGLNAPPFPLEFEHSKSAATYAAFQRMADYSLPSDFPELLPRSVFENTLKACLHCEQVARPAFADSVLAIKRLVLEDLWDCYQLTHIALCYGWTMELGCPDWLPQNWPNLKREISRKLTAIYRKVGPTDLGIEALAFQAVWYFVEDQPPNALAEILAVQCENGGWESGMTPVNDAELGGNHHTTILALWLLLELGAKPNVW